jgi:hypothetical protein
MKKLTNVKTTVTGSKVTICADIVDAAPTDFKWPVQQTTVGWLNPANLRWPRHIQISSEAVFVKSMNGGMAITNDDLVALAALVEPKTSFPPFFKSFPSPQSLTVDFSTELDPKLQWQVSDTPLPDGKWTDIEGAISRTLDNPPKGKFVRCVASSEAGATATPAIRV